MLFLTLKPTNLIVSQHNRIILTTPKQIIFTSLHFIEEYISKQLVQYQPTILQYSSAACEAIVANSEAIHIFWTDWLHKVELKHFITLHREAIYSIQWNKCWEIYGNFKQYSPNNARLCNIRNVDEDFSSCFLGSQQFILTNKRVVLYEHRANKRSNIEWSEWSEWIRKRKDAKGQMKSISGVDKKVILQIQSSCFLIEDFKVQSFMENEGELHINEQLAIWTNFSSPMLVYQIIKNNFVKLGQIESIEGHFYGSAMNLDCLALVIYDFKELKVKQIQFLDDQEKQKQDLQRRQRAELKKQINSPQDSEQHAVGYQHPSTSLGESGHEKLNLTNSIQLKMKASIERFQQQLQRSFQEQKYNEISQQIVQSQNYKDYQIEEKIEERLAAVASVNADIGIDSLDCAPQSQLNRNIEVLFEQGESGFEWQQLEHSNVRSSICLV